MKNNIYLSLSIMALLFVVSCGTSTYGVMEPKPTLEVVLLQETTIVKDPFFIQVNASQKGYDGAYQISVVLLEGSAECSINGSEIPTTGDWTKMGGPSEMLTILPLATGRLRLSLEAKTADGAYSGRSSVNITVQQSTTLTLEVKAPEVATLTEPIEIILNAKQPGFSGVLPIKYELKNNSGALQYGALVVASGESFSIPTNSEQILYYSSTTRGVHRLQFAATDGTTTIYKSIEIVLTK